MWTSENPPKYNRHKLRYPSDLTDDEVVAHRADYSAGQTQRHLMSIPFTAADRLPPTVGK
jgi:hypothetical protein